MQPTKASIRDQLAREILALEGYKPSLHNATLDGDLGAIRYAFPGARFPLGVVRKFLSEVKKEKQLTPGFVSVVVSRLLKRSGTALWITSDANVTFSFGADIGVRYYAGASNFHRA